MEQLVLPEQLEQRVTPERPERPEQLARLARLVQLEQQVCKGQLV
jgi:hypothetical protein